MSRSRIGIKSIDVDCRFCAPQLSGLRVDMQGFISQLPEEIALAFEPEAAAIDFAIADALALIESDSKSSAKATRVLQYVLYFIEGKVTEYVTDVLAVLEEKSRVTENTLSELRSPVFARAQVPN